MNGAEALIRTLADSGIEVCFANPGTSEMQLVAALDGEPRIRAVLGLFEGVVTGAADGYGRMADSPAATLLHLGPGLANGLSNLHNARRAHTPVVNIVGDHATDHLQYDAPLTSDVHGIAAPMSDWLRASESPSDLAAAGAEAVAEALGYPGRIATVIAPADHAWTDGASAAAPIEGPSPQRASDELVEQARSALSANEGTALFLGGRALREESLAVAGRIAAATGCRLICETFPARLQRGAGRVELERLPYFAEMAVEHLEGLGRIVFVGAKPPVAFFAYPDKPSWLSPADAEIVELAPSPIDAHDALKRLASSLRADTEPETRELQHTPTTPDGALDAQSMGQVIAELMPQDAIVSDEAATAGLAIFPLTAGAPAHDWLTLTGGSIGQGLPLATGAALACPDRKVIALQADGSAMYTVQALWTIARENLDITTVIINNGSYAILNVELARVGVASPGPKALSLLDLTKPEIDWASLSESLGVPSARAETVADFRKALDEALSRKGPSLVEAIIPAGVG